MSKWVDSSEVRVQTRRYLISPADVKCLIHSSLVTEVSMFCTNIVLRVSSTLTLSNVAGRGG